jgi:hypothetical protein
MVDSFSPAKCPRLNASHRALLSRGPLFTFSLSLVVLVGACATAPDHGSWIKIGRTTKAEVVERYGQPDLVMASEESETAIYRPSDPRRTVSPGDIPTVQAGPLGLTTTKMEPVGAGLRTGSTNDGLLESPEQELRIRYNAQGVVEEVIPLPPSDNQ